MQSKAIFKKVPYHLIMMRAIMPFPIVLSNTIQSRVFFNECEIGKRRRHYCPTQLLAYLLTYAIYPFMVGPFQGKKRQFGRGRFLEMARESNSDVLFHWRSVAARRESELIFAENRSPSFQKKHGSGLYKRSSNYSAINGVAKKFHREQKQRMLMRVYYQTERVVTNK